MRSTEKPVAEVLHRTPDGEIRRKYVWWRRPCTDIALAEWIEDYIESGFVPPNFDYAPIPHCARVHQNGRVVAEWIRRA